MRRCFTVNVVVAVMVKNILLSSANHALSIAHPMLKARSLAEGSKRAKAKAFRSAGNSFSSFQTSSNRCFFFFYFIFILDDCCFAEFIQPVKERPKTDCAVAQRMVTRALGLQKRSRVQRYCGKSLTPDLSHKHQSQSLASKNYYLFKNVMQTS